ncbi:MAG: hypothetical protein N3C61_01270 [Candidatus Micrarchaeota archaeon]|nr:hypothetical protein [Candidatus Micrarchaeota archaeon]
MIPGYEYIIGIAMLIYLVFLAIVFSIGKILSNQIFLRYVDLGVKEFVILAIFMITTVILHKFIYTWNVDPNFVISIFYGSNVRMHQLPYLSASTIYNVSREYARYMINLSNNLLYRLVEMEGRMYHFSSFSCQKCNSDITIGGFDLGCFMFPNSLSVYSIVPYTNYLEPAAQTLASARNSLEMSTKIIGSYYGLINLASTRAIYVLLVFGILLRLIPGMKFAANTIIAISFVIIIILPIIIYLQSNIFSGYIANNIHDYYNRIDRFVESIPDYIYPDDILSPIQLSLQNLFTDPTDPCGNIVLSPTIEYMPNEADMLYRIRQNSIRDSEIKRAYQSIFLVSTFSLSTTVVAMIIAAKGIVMLLGERFSFLDLFLRVI